MSPAAPLQLSLIGCKVGRCDGSGWRPVGPGDSAYDLVANRNPQALAEWMAWNETHRVRAMCECNGWNTHNGA